MHSLALLLADGTAPVAAPSSWLSPEGLNVVLTLLLFVVAPIVVALLRRFEKGALADKLAHATQDAIALRGALVSTVRGVEALRKRTSLDVATDLARTIEQTSRADGTHGVLAAVVEAVTAPGSSATAAPTPVVVDPVVAAVRSATGRVGPRMVS